MQRKNYVPSGKNVVEWLSGRLVVLVTMRQTSKIVFRLEVMSDALSFQNSHATMTRTSNDINSVKRFLEIPNGW